MRTQSEQAIAIAQAYLNKGQIKESWKTLNIAFLRSPSDSQLSLELARLCLKLNKTADAIKVLEKSVSSGNQSAEVLYMLATTLFLNKQTEQAKLTINTMIRLHPDFGQAYNLLGNILYQQQDISNALKAYEKSLLIKPDDTNTLNNIAWLLRAEGETESAIAHFRKAIETSPSASEAIFGLSTLKADNELLSIVEQAKKSASFTPKQEAELLFAKAKAFENAGEPGKAFDSYQKANHQWRKIRPFDLAREKRFFSAIKDTFSSDIPPSQAESNPDLPTPIFVVGLPRSSTTLIEQILASHSQVSGAGELAFLPQIALPLIGSDIDESTIEKIRDRYLQLIRPLANNKNFVVDKLPQNFLLIGLIHRCFPEAKIIHCSRNPIDHCVSLFKHHFPMSNHDYIYSLNDIEQYYHLYRDLMTHWKESSQAKCYELSYEELVDNLSSAVQSLLDYCELDFEDACLEYHKTQRNIRTASSEQVRQEISRDSIDQWKQYEPYLEELIANLQSYS